MRWLFAFKRHETGPARNRSNPLIFALRINGLAPARNVRLSHDEVSLAMRFFEQICDGRLIIADTIIAKDDGKDRVTREIDAACWIDAKKSFGYPLSVVQEWLLDQFYEKRNLPV